MAAQTKFSAARLVFVGEDAHRPPGVPATYYIQNDSAKTRLGRTSTCELRLMYAEEQNHPNNVFVSGTHATIAYCKRTGWTIRDGSQDKPSVNGVYVQRGDQLFKVEKQSPLQYEDVIRIGNPALVKYKEGLPCIFYFKFEEIGTPPSGSCVSPSSSSLPAAQASTNTPRGLFTEKRHLRWSFPAQAFSSSNAPSKKANRSKSSRIGTTEDACRKQSESLGEKLLMANSQIAELQRKVDKQEEIILGQKRKISELETSQRSPRGYPREWLDGSAGSDDDFV
jgi:hypothetical protein